MWLTKSSIRRPVACAMFFVAIAVLGFRSFSGMLVERTPRVDIPIVNVSTAYRGAGPEEIETLITDKLEEGIASSNNLKYLTSVSRDGVSLISAEFEIGVNMDTALADVRQKVDAVLKDLPLDAERPVVTKLDISARPVLTIGVSSPRPIKQTKFIAQKIISQRFQQVRGVAGAPVVGGEDREVKVLVDRGRLDAYGLSISEVARAIGADTVDTPSGEVREPVQQFPVRVLGQYRSVEELAKTRLHFAARAGRPPLHLDLRELGDVYDGAAERNDFTRVNGQEAVTINVQKSSEANTIQVIDGVNAAMAQLRQQLPDFKFAVTMDQSERVREDQTEVTMHLIIDILLVVLTVWAFLHDLRGTVIVALAIPSALLATFIPMFFGGLSLNIMTMLGLLVVIGILVDDAIVVLENIHRHLDAGESPKEAAFNGRTEIGLAAIAITLTDVVVFMPIVFLGGQTGLFFRHFAVTVVVATLFSLFISFSLTPMLAAILYRRGESLEPRGRLGLLLEKFWHSLDERYRRALTGALRPESSTQVLVAVVLSLAGIYVLSGLGLVWRAWWTAFDALTARGEMQHAVSDTVSGVLPAALRLAPYLGLMLAWNLGARRFLVVLAAYFVAYIGMGQAPATVGKESLILTLLVCGIGLALATVPGAPGRPKSEGSWRGLDDFFTLRPRSAVIFTGFAALLVVQSMFGPKLGFQFIPATDEGEIAITVEAPAGTSLLETDRIVHQLEAIARSYPETRDVTSITGQVTGGFRSFGEAGSQYAIVSLTLHHKLNPLDRLFFWRKHERSRERSDQDLAVAMREQVARIPGAKIYVIPIRGFQGAVAPVQIEVRGRDLDEMNRLSAAYIKKLREFPFILNPDVSWRVGSPEVQIRIDRVRASQLGLSVAEIGRMVRDSIEGNRDYRYREGADEFDIRVQLAAVDRNSIESVSKLVLGHVNGSPIRLSDVARVGHGLGPNKIERRQRERRILITANLTRGMPLGNAMQTIMPEIMKIPRGHLTLDVAGEAQRLAEDQKNFSAAFGLSIILVYILMAMLFESALHPFTIMFCLPMALVGAISALVLTGMTLSVISIIGFIMLMGLVTKNAILLIDYTNTLRARGVERDEALRTAGPTRLRPILMTTMTLIMGLMPLSLKIGGAGTESRAPLAVAVQGGLILSTLLTLLVIPCLYAVFDDVVIGINALRERRRRGGVQPRGAVPALVEAEALAENGHHAETPSHLLR